MTQQSQDGTHDSEVGTKPMTAGESAPAQRSIQAPRVLTAPETMAAAVKLHLVADLSQLLGKEQCDCGAEL